MQAKSEKYLAEIGRLTASIVHEINNPMQAIRGAVMLTMEEADQPEVVKDYMKICQEESDRVIRLTDLIRGIYHPGMDEIQSFSIGEFINDILSLTREETNRFEISIETELANGEQIILGNRQQYELALISGILDLSDGISTYCNLISLYSKQKNELVEINLVPSNKGNPDQPEIVQPRLARLHEYIDLSLPEEILNRTGDRISWTNTNGKWMLCYQIHSREMKGG
jgi:phosphoglycerate-specific signal transduction histidine kinase